MTQLMEYRGEQTFFHAKLHPLTKMIVFFLVVFLTGLWLDVRYLAPVFIVGLILAFIARTPKAWFLVMLTALLLTWFPTLRSTVAQANPDYYKVLDPTWAGTSVLTIDVPFLGLNRLGLTYGSLYWLAGRVTRFAAVVTWALLFITTTPMSDIANTLYALKVPQPIVFVIQITYKFIPYMASMLGRISDAQKLRGWNLRTWNLVKLFKRSIPMANPIIRRAAVTVDQVTIAVQVRGFGAGEVTPMVDLKLSTLDKAVIYITAAGFIFAIVALVLWHAGQI